MKKHAPGHRGSIHLPYHPTISDGLMMYLIRENLDFQIFDDIEIIRFSMILRFSDFRLKFQILRTLQAHEAVRTYGAYQTTIISNRFFIYLARK